MKQRVARACGVLKQFPIWAALSSVISCGHDAGAPAPVAPTVSLSASPTSVQAQATTTLTWVATGATSCTASGAWSGPQAISGSLAVVPPSTAATFTLICTGAGGTGQGSVNVTVLLPTDPVAGSSSDTTLEGSDANGNGVRDDLEIFIAQSYSDVTQQAVMFNYAKTATVFLLASDPASAAAAAHAVDSAAICGYNAFGFAGYRTERFKIQAALLNTDSRLQAYYDNDHLLDGVDLGGLSTLTCNLDGAPYNGTP